MQFALVIVGITILALVVLNALSFFRPGSSKEMSVAEQAPLSGAEEAERLLAKDVLPEKELKEISPIIEAIKEADDKLHRAGFIYEWQRWIFLGVQVGTALVAFTLFTSFVFRQSGNQVVAFVGGLTAMYLGLKFPERVLERLINKHQQAVRDYFPGLIDDILIAVAGGVSVSAAVSALVQLDEENADYNPAMTLFKTVMLYLQAGMTFEDALKETAEETALPEVKHTLRLLAHCERYGGDISGQLTALADALLFQKQMFIEEKLASLPVKASVPLALIFGGFFAFLFASLFVAMMNSGLSEAL